MVFLNILPVAMKEVVLKENKAPTIASYMFIDSFHSAQNSVFYIVCVCKILVGSFPNLGGSSSICL